MTLVFIMILFGTSTCFAQYSNVVSADQIISDIRGNTIINIKDSIVIGDLYFTDSGNPFEEKDSEGNTTYVIAINPSIRFTNVVFKDVVWLSGSFEDEYSVFRNNVSFINCVFESDASFSRTHYNKNFTITDSEFKENAYFDDMKFDLHIDIQGTKVNSEPLKFDIIKDIEAKNIISMINNGLDININHAIIHGDIDFSNVTISKISSGIVFKNSTFKGALISYKNSKGKTITFEKDVIFDGNRFEKDLTLSTNIFLKSFVFKNNVLKERINISGSVFYENSVLRDNSFIRGTLGTSLNTKAARFLRGINSTLTQLRSTYYRRTGEGRGYGSGITYTDINSSDLLEKINSGKIEYFENMIVTGDFDMSKISTKDKKYLFLNLKFKNKVYFGDNSSGNKHFKSLLIFDKCSFEGDALFDKVSFDKETSFTKSKFLGKASFNHTVFNSVAIFDGVNFSQEPDFKGCTSAFGLSFYTTKLNNKSYDHQ